MSSELDAKVEVDTIKLLNSNIIMTTKYFKYLLISYHSLLFVKVLPKIGKNS